MDLPSIERACEVVLVGGVGTPQERSEAQQRVLALGADVSNISIIQSILDGSENNYAIVVAAQSLLRLVTDHWNSFSEGQHVEIRNYILTFLANKGPRLQSFAITVVVQLLCRISKFAWFDEGTSIREIVTETKKFLQATISHCVIGLRILNELVTEMNVKNRNRTLTQHRRIAVSFRDNSLLATFEISLSMLNQIATRSISLEGMAPSEAARAEDTLLEQSLLLLNACLSFDFIGTNPDESSEEAGTLQVPTGWRDRIQNGASLRLLFNVYKGATTGRIPLIPDAPAPPVAAAAQAGSGGTPGSGLRSARRASTGAVDGGPPLSGALGVGGGSHLGPMRDFPRSASRARSALECLCLLVSVRRSLFSSELERKRFLGHIIRGVCDILREEQGLGDADCYHQFARLLSKVKNNFQLSELVRTEGYAEWIDAVATFTIASCGKPVWASNSMHYILGLWSRLVASVPYVRMEASSTNTASSSSSSAPQPIGSNDILIDAYIPKIIGAYLRGRVDSLVGPQAEEALEELNDIECIEDQLEQLPGICRYQYEAVSSVVLSIVDPLLQRYSDGIAYLRDSGASASESVVTALRVAECQLAWAVAVIGAILSGAGQTASISSYFSAPAVASSLGSPGASSSIVLGDEAFDADLSRRVLSLIAQVDARVSAAAASAGGLPSSAAASPLVRFVRPDARLELAFVYFMSAFRKAYISEHSGMPPPPPPADGSSSSAVAASSSVFGRTAVGPLSPISTSASALLLAGSGGTAMAQSNGTGSGSGGVLSLQEQYTAASGRQKVFLAMFIRMGLGDHVAVVSMMIGKIANNLRFWVEREDVIRRTLEVFHDLVVSYSSGRLLLSLDSVSSLLAHHTPEHFPFLSVPANSRFRTTFYTALARLVFMEEDSERFEPFVAPLVAVLDKLSSAVSSSLRTEEVMRTLIGVCRDLRGVLAGAHNRATYMQVFDALFPNYIHTVSRAADVWADTPAVSTVVLKLIAELVFNRAQRISFGTNSPNGILLFREASATVCNYGRKIHGFTPAFGTDAYPVKYKGIAESMRIVNRCLDGGYVNFGVFALYGDRALDSAFDTVFQLALSIQPAELASFTKLSQQFMTFLHVTCRSHMEALAGLPQPAFLRVMSALKDGIDSLDPEVSTHAASALDHLSAYYVRHLKKDTPTAKALRMHIGASPGIFEALMKVLFQILVFGEAANQWALARPLLGLIIAAESARPDACEAFKQDMVRSQPGELQPRMSDELAKLFSKDVLKTLDVVNRDRFVQKLTVFRLSVKEHFAVPN